MILRDHRLQMRDVLAAALAGAGFCALTTLGAARANAQEPAGAPAERPATHTVKKGDTLWDIAKLYLGDPFQWPEIYRLNTDKIENPHWIYPGEVFKLPGADDKTLADASNKMAGDSLAVVTPVEPVVRDTSAANAANAANASSSNAAASEPVLTPAPALQAQPVAEAEPQREEPAPTIRASEYVAAPWVDAHGGPKGSGYLIGARDLMGIEGSERSGRLGFYDNVVIAPPAGSRGAEHERYLTYRLGPSIPDFGQIIIPTGIVEIVRPARNGEAAVGRVLRMFGDVLEGQRVVPMDSAYAVGSSRPSPVSNGKTGKVRWILNEPVLPSLQNYVVVDIPRGEVSPGDQIDLYFPKKGPSEGRDLAIPELWIARAQVLRVTSRGASAIVISHEQPRIEAGTAARVAARMP